MTGKQLPIPPADPGEPAVLTVAALTRFIRQTLESRVGKVEVEGEISNFKVYGSGHAYFTLKVDQAQISCVMFKGRRMGLGFDPAEGEKVIATGNISVYEPRGQYQLIVSSLRQTGLGALYQKFLELKAKLETEGLFDPARKRPLPALPRRIGVVTSASGAAIRDICNVVARRFSGAEIILSPSLVQGDRAPDEIIRAMERLRRFHESSEEDRGLDVLIVGRGGGSIEDLWAFNSEAVARAIADYPVPVVSAVGHETDFTIADFVADLRAPTPSAAAEVVVPDGEELLQRISNLEQRARRAVTERLERNRSDLRRLLGSWGLRQPLELVRQAIQKLDELDQRMVGSIEQRIKDQQKTLSNLEGHLQALNPQAVLERGYSIVSRARDKRVVTRKGQLRVSDHVRIQVSNGELRGQIIPPGDDLFDGEDI
ncbi:MAG: exodeoxyribonuclease VII large subunit [Candidatus Sumerlaeota bacterium]